MAFPFYRQPDHMDCGPTCLRMIAKYYGKNVTLGTLRELTETTREGSSFQGLCDAAETMGFRTMAVQVSYQDLVAEAPLPCIAFWNQQHFVVVYKIKKDKIYVADPAHGLLVYNAKEFISCWIGKDAHENTEDGILLLLEATPELQNYQDENPVKRNSLQFLWRYLFRYKQFMVQLSLGLLVGTVLQLVFPFLTQSIVDIGIQTQNLPFVYLVLAAQLMLFVGQISLEVIRSWILLHLSTRINISLLSDFFIKLMNLPIAFFDSKVTGDIFQRIRDHQRIEKLLTTTSLNVLFSMVNLVIFGGILAWYSGKIFAIFAISASLYIIWILLFLKRREDLDYKMFTQNSQEQSKTIELVSGMHEIKLHNAERRKRWGWEKLQAKIFKVRVKGLALEQVESVGGNFINELKNILISVFSAQLVIDGQITLGMMMSISYIIGQLNAPLSQMINFIHTYQDAKIALERLSEIHNKDNEENPESIKHEENMHKHDMVLKNVSFRYRGETELVLDDISLTIPAGKTTAIVGASGSGKTTLMKLLLKFYEPTKGEIKLGNTSLSKISHRLWRSISGVVMQDGFIFNESIAQNIAVGDEKLDKEKIKHAVEVANIQEFITDLPLGYNTKIGMDGVGISGGQKQRILIARAVYKNPDILFFDEATSALDANNEKVIMQHLEEFMKKRTAIVIAHRLSTVRHADQIIVLDKGKILEIGNHDSLIEAKGAYYRLVKNQLDLEKIGQHKVLETT